ncbi:NDR1/HIN1-like protein 26 [Cicer arietinum]|uniref:NDR1/HIN1-like protein 26 n=1 Tax=Cicer arietinum TaxID=3827 RepID=A0A1S2XZ76_CICAR|nr:NDR1/HIN1-like protein 26 [Cicer arietinum]
MYGNDHIPVHHASGQNPNPKPVKRHHSTKYYIQRVQDSLTTRVSKMVCTVFLSLLAIIGLIIFIIWLSLRPHRPRFFIHEFTLPGLAQQSSYGNAQVTFKVNARNSNQNIGVYYESMDGSVYYRNQKIGSIPLLSSFYQGPKNTTEVDGVFSGTTLTISSQGWSEIQNDRDDGSVMFSLELTSVIKFKISTWGSKRHKMHANCDVAVGPDGSLLHIYKDKKCPVYFD